MMPPQGKTQFSLISSDSILVGAIIAALAVQISPGLAPWGGVLRAQWQLLITIGLVLVAIGALGVGLTGKTFGAVIDNRNRVSLSKLQMLLWTVLVLSSMATATSQLMVQGAAEPLKLDAPWELFAAMGISAVSLVASPLVLSRKLEDNASAAAIDRAQAADSTIRSVGQVAVRERKADARFSDIFKGDDISNVASPDLSKIQNFGITLLLLGAYLAALCASFARYFDGAPAADIDLDGVKAALASVADAVGAVRPNQSAATAADVARQASAAAVAKLGDRQIFPELHEEFLWLMGVSHGAYLIYKASPHGGAGASAEVAQETPVVHALG